MAAGSIGSASALRPTWRDRLRASWSTGAVLGAAVLVYLVTVLVVPEFASSGHLADTLQLASVLGVVSVGAGLVILSAGIDLSIAGVMTGVGVLASSMAGSGAGSVTVIVVALLAGAALGAVNGTGVAVLGIPPLVMTLATGSVVQGAQLVATNGTPQSAAPRVLESLANDEVLLGLTGSVVVWFALVALAAGLLAGTATGRRMYAIGTNPRAAELSGVPVRRVTILTYAISGLTAAIGGLLLLGYTGIASSTMGDAYLLPAIAAVVLGGTSILGGRGTALGVAFGVFLLTVIQSLLTVLKVSEAGREMLQGAILLAVVILYNLRATGPRR
jgi:ribose transport system permease protein